MMASADRRGVSTPPSDMHDSCIPERSRTLDIMHVVLYSATATHENSAFRSRTFIVKHLFLNHALQRPVRSCALQTQDYCLAPGYLASSATRSCDISYFRPSPADSFASHRVAGRHRAHCFRHCVSSFHCTIFPYDHFHLQ